MFYNWYVKVQGRSSKFGNWNIRRYYGKMFQIMSQSGAVQGEVLEIGPGCGQLAYLFQEAGVQYHAVERSPQLQKALVEDGFDVRLGCATLLPFEGQQFDLVFAIAVLEHMATFEQAITMLQECHRVLKPGGVLALLAPDYLRAGIDFYDQDYTHAFMTTPRRVEQLIDDGGFQLERLVHVTGSISSPIRIVIDLVGFAVQNRFVYWLGASLGFDSLLYKWHKTFEPAFMVVTRKLDSEALSVSGQLHQGIGS